MYKLLKDINTILRIEDKATIPVNEENWDYKCYIAWIALGNIPEAADEPVIAIPQIISRFQAKAQLHNDGLLILVESMIAESGALVKLAWADAQDFNRQSPTLKAIGLQLNLSDEQLDTLFISASQITI